MKKLKLLIIVSVIAMSCNEKNENSIQSTKNETQIIKKKDKLCGQFKFDLSKRLKGHESSISGTLMLDVLKRAFNYDVTFHGDGSGVTFLHSSKDEIPDFITKKELEKSQFKYKIQNDTIYVSDASSKGLYTPYLVIIDESIKGDYFEIIVPKKGDKDKQTTSNLAMYKIGDYND